MNGKNGGKKTLEIILQGGAPGPDAGAVKKLEEALETEKKERATERFYWASSLITGILVISVIYLKDNPFGQGIIFIAWSFLESVLAYWMKIKYASDFIEKVMERFLHGKGD